MTQIAYQTASLIELARSRRLRDERGQLSQKAGGIVRIYQGNLTACTLRSWPSVGVSRRSAPLLKRNASDSWFVVFIIDGVE